MAGKTRRMQKNLTVMFTDISGFTKHTEQVSREQLMARLETHNELLMPVIAHFEGRIIKTIGDSFLITFESPTNAVQCGLFMQFTLARHNQDRPEPDQIHIKVSINSGEVTVTENDVFGDPVNVAAKIEKATQPDEIYFTESVFLAMNKSEVPTSFVMTFRPKGTDSQEIKLYKVVMDESDERYQRIVNGTKIDAEKMQTRVLELASTAEKEFGRYHDALESLVASQRGASRSTVIAIVAAAVILGAAVIIGFAVFAGGNDDRAVMDTVRNYLANDRPQDARELLQNYMAASGESAELTDLLGEINAYELRTATSQAMQTLEDGDTERARRILEAALANSEGGEEQQSLLAAIRAFDVTQQAIMRNDLAAARVGLAASAEYDVALTYRRGLEERVEALESVRAILADPEQARTRSEVAVEDLERALGSRFSHPDAQQLAARVFKAHVYHVAHDGGMEPALAAIDALRRRFDRVDTGWSRVHREALLGALNHFSRTSRHGGWWRHIQSAFTDIYYPLRDAAEGDAEFQYRLGREIYDINRRLNLVLVVEQIHFRAALELKPEFLEQHRDQWLAMCRTWLRYESDWASLGRELVREHFMDDLQAELTEGLHATRLRNRETHPDTTLRANSYAVLADAGLLRGVLKEPAAYFRENLRMFVENNWEQYDDQGNQRPQTLTRDQARALFSLPLQRDEYDEIAGLLQRTAEDTDARTGTFGSQPHVAVTCRTLLADLREAHPEYD
jgi:class 3 adenylate cyclase